MSVAIKTIEKALRAWINDAICVKTIFAHQNAPKPVGQFALVNLVQNTVLGHGESDLERQDDDSIEAEYSNVYNLMVSVNVFRDDAFSKVVSLRDSICLITVKDNLWAAGLAFATTSDVRDIPDVTDKTWEERAQIDFFFHVRSLECETINEIKKVEITNQLDGSTTIVE
ncbi:hypothetical protein KAR91_14800 [Candidatus Pacearchaeota archaeon]|nr:hypothetical protein [Candidatus Pacearchaeota archaeon]